MEKAKFCVCRAGILVPGHTESDIEKQVFKLAAADYGTRKHWHQRLPRIGTNSVHPIYDKVPDETLKEDDIVFIDLGPVFGDIEADFARTYVLGMATSLLKCKVLLDPCLCCSLAMMCSFPVRFLTKCGCQTSAPNCQCASQSCR